MQAWGGRRTDVRDTPPPRQPLLHDHRVATTPLLLFYLIAWGGVPPTTDDSITLPGTKLDPHREPAPCTDACFSMRCQVAVGKPW